MMRKFASICGPHKRASASAIFAGLVCIGAALWPFLATSGADKPDF